MPSLRAKDQLGMTDVPSRAGCEVVSGLEKREKKSGSLRETFPRGCTGWIGGERDQAK